MGLFPMLTNLLAEAVMPGFGTFGLALGAGGIDDLFRLGSS